MRRMTLAAICAVALLVMSGCATLGGGWTEAERPFTPQQPPASMAALAKFYKQPLKFEQCGDLDCAKLNVPLDYSKPDADTIELSVVRVRARKESKVLGALVVNPGGPGASGVDYASAADFIVGAPVRDRYDIVGFDPRGVGRSAPIDCLSDAELDEFLGADPTPDDAAEQQQFAQGAKEFGEKCKANAGPLLGHVSTVDAAKDMEILRANLGQDRLHFLGKSYGTFLGATYADLFPAQVGRFVLDGAIAPDLTSAEVNLGQAKGFEAATRAWAQDCADSGKCALGETVDEIMQGLRDFLLAMDAKPLEQTGDEAVTKLTEGWASTGIAAAMYDEAQWGILTDAINLAVDGDGSDLMSLANSYADRNPGGGYAGNIMEAISAVNCLDRPESGSVADFAAAAEKARAAAPTWGPFIAWSAMTCASWPVTPEADGGGGRDGTGSAAGSATGPKKISAVGAPPIVVVGTTRDPATPYEWAVRLSDQLAKSSLVTYDGDGHTAYTRSNRCVDGAIDSFYLDGTVPRDGLRC